MNWRVFKMKSEYERMIKNAFPKQLQSDVDAVIQILPLADENPICGSYPLIVSSWQIRLEDELLTVPYRIYFKEPELELESALNERQTDILNCIYSRHHNGYVRSKRLKRISDHAESWVIPFVIQLLGEYVWELFPIINTKINESTLHFYKDFRLENPTYWRLLESRVVSYWNEYYRDSFPKWENYFGNQVLSKIK